MNVSPVRNTFQAGTIQSVLTKHAGRLTSMSRRDSCKPSVKALRILIPINANEESRWGVEYALNRHRDGNNVEVILLNVGEPITQWEVLRFRTQQEIAQFQSERAQAFVDEAAIPLVAMQIPCRGLFKQGNLVFSILDTAEELDCDEIAMPAPKRGLSRYFSRGIVDAVKCRRRDVAVTLVNSEGEPEVPH